MVTRTSPSPSALQEGRLAKLVENFEAYLSVFDERGPFRKPEQLGGHLATLARLRELGSAAAACADAEFARRLQLTLTAWGIGSRSAAPVTGEAFHASLAAQSEALTALDGLTIENPNLDLARIIPTLWDIISHLRLAIGPTGEPLKAPLVSGSKALHHLLPDLVMPIDRQYTQAFFGWRNPEFQYAQETRFTEVFSAFADLAAAVQPSRFVGAGWRTCRTKILDSALVGYCIAENVRKTP